MKNKKTALVGILFMLLMVMSIMSSASAAIITITPGTTPVLYSYSTSTLTTTEIADLVGATCILCELYKQNVDGPEVGTFASSYETSFFNTPSDPADATIEYVGVGNIITGDPLYLLVKDGNHTPQQYIFDLNNLNGVAWNGTDTLSLVGFWPNQGAISHVSIYGCNSSDPVPEPATVLLLVGGLLGLGFFRFKK